MLPHVLISTTIPILTNKQLRMMLCVRSGEIPLVHLSPLSSVPLQFTVCPTTTDNELL